MSKQFQTISYVLLQIKALQKILKKKNNCHFGEMWWESLLSEIFFLFENWLPLLTMANSDFRRAGPTIALDYGHIFRRELLLLTPLSHWIITIVCLITIVENSHFQKCLWSNFVWPLYGSNSQSSLEGRAKGVIHLQIFVGNGRSPFWKKRRYFTACTFRWVVTLVLP